MVARGWAVDVSYELGQAWPMDRPLAGVTVLEDPADAGLRPVRLGVPTPFYVPSDEVVISAPTRRHLRSPRPRRRPGPTRIPAWGWRRAARQRSRRGRPFRRPRRLPPPLTPIVTTPTPEVTPTLALPAEGSAASTGADRPDRNPSPCAGSRCVGGSGGRRAVGTRIRPDARAPGHLADGHSDTASARPNAASRPDTYPAVARGHTCAGDRARIAAEPLLAGTVGSSLP